MKRSTIGNTFAIAAVAALWRPYLLALGFALGVTSNLLGADPTFTSIDFPGAALTRAHGINPRGDIVGQYVSAGLTHGFLLSGGQFTTIDVPGAASTQAFGINPRGTSWECT